MTLLLGTRDGLYVVPDGNTRGADRPLAAPVNRVRRFEGPGVLAATDEGIYRSVGGREWTALGTVGHPVHAVQATKEGRIYAGTRPARVYASDDGGSSWRELADLQATTADADSPSNHGGAVRALAADPTRSGRFLAGVDPGGVCVSEDSGETWARASGNPDAGVNHLLGGGTDAPLAESTEPRGSYGPDESSYVASTGNGAYRSDDVGGSWERLDGPRSAHLEAIVHDARLFAAAREQQAQGAVVVEYDLRDGSGTTRQVGDESDEFVRSLASHMGRLLAGTVREGEQPGRVLVRNPGGSWSTLGETPAGVVSMVGI